MLIKENSTNKYQIQLSVNVTHDKKEIVYKIDFWDKERNSMSSYGYMEKDYNKAVEKYNSFEKMSVIS